MSSQKWKERDDEILNKTSLEYLRSISYNLLKPACVYSEISQIIISFLED
ncbi:predicted protein [Botrytis cinerea T4]|uniref:Uncharacterized protein n=1 Tax=Botryotinia fuckeliana (strain T4) TaxID=999810 RepID=G2XWA4_BOTF4|nr:predicted protein [Botrytis cinerea T4]